MPHTAETRVSPGKIVNVQGNLDATKTLRKTVKSVEQTSFVVLDEDDNNIKDEESLGHHMEDTERSLQTKGKIEVFCALI